ncbi:MAG: hypothetical protein JW701_00580 [Kosmotogaceae bacterium]|nr:hypothetical protein [Kosmotogaceae bacterium]
MLEFAILLTSMLAGMLTQEIGVYKRFGTVKASSMVSLIFGLIFWFMEQSQPSYGLPPIMSAVAMGASFVAMSSLKVIPDRKWMAVACIFFGFVFIVTSPSLKGLGGLLGTAACVSVLVTLGVIRFMNFLHRTNRRKL